jgi:pimeloyl-ACP methyl ester carboxylesterase
MTQQSGAPALARTADGRRIAYREYGTPDGLPLLYFPGTPSAAPEWLLWPPGAAERCGLRVISVDCPGLGGSDWLPRRRMLDWPADVAALADELGLERFRVLGYSGGAPYALACAQLLPDRVIVAGAAACVGPDDLPGLVEGLAPAVARARHTARRWPWLARLTWMSVRMALSRYPERVLAQTADALPDPDRRALAEPRVAAAYLEALREALRRGTAGAARDMALMAGPWELDPGCIRVPVLLWQGGEDRNAPPVMARSLGRRIPHCTVRWHPNEGHLSLVTEHGEQILAELAPAAR